MNKIAYGSKPEMVYFNVKTNEYLPLFLIKILKW